jgi:hypothetical protein
MIQHHLPDAWSAETAGAPYPVPSCRSTSGWYTRHGPLLPYGQRTGRIACRRRPRRLTVLSPAAAAPTVARP